MYGISAKHFNANTHTHTYSYSLSMVSLSVNGSRRDTKKRREEHVTSPFARRRPAKQIAVETKESRKG
jgi:hypothetical protein